MPTTNCPADATTPLADGAPIKIGFIGPQTGPLAAFGQIAPGMKVLFDKVNAAGGVDGHKIEVVTKDDAYDPAKSEAGRAGGHPGRQDLRLGHPDRHPERCGYSRRLRSGLRAPGLGRHGLLRWGDPANHPWTVGGIMSYPTEAIAWTEFLKDKYPNGAKVAQLVYNNDFGKSYQKQFEKTAADNGFDVVSTVTHEATSDLSNEVTQILASNPDVILAETTATFCTNLMKLARQGGFTGPIILSATCQSVQNFVAPAGEAAAEAYTIVTQKDPSDPAFADDPEMKQYFADVQQYGGGADPKLGNTATGYDIATVIVDNLTRAAAMEGGLTRANMMNAVWSTDLSLPLAAGGKYKVDGTKDAYAVEDGYIAVFDPASGGYKDTGFKVNLEGKTGVFSG